jgi:hypothetical protein
MPRLAPTRSAFALALLLVAAAAHAQTYVGVVDPAGDPSLHDLDWRDGALWATDTNPDRLIRIDPATGAVTSAVALAFDPRGLAFDGVASRISTGFDQSSPLIYTVNAAGATTGQIPAPSALTNGLTFFGGRLFAARAYPDDQAALVGLDPATGAVLETIPFPSAQPTGIAFLNDGTLWASNAGDDSGSNGVYRLYHIDRATGAVLGTLDAPPGTTRTRGLAYDGSRYLYVVVQSATFTSVIYKVDLQSTGNPVLSLSDESVDFGIVVTGQTATRTVTISNTGDGPLQITDVNVVNTDNGFFSTTLTPTTVPAGGQVQAQVSWAAGFEGAPSPGYGALGFTTNDVNRPSVLVNLTGFPVLPDPTVRVLNTAGHDFGPVRVDAGQNLTVAVWPLTIQNVGAQPLTVTSVTSSNPAFGLYAADLPLTLAPTATAEIPLSFRPTTPGPQSATVSVASNDAASPLAVALSGTGTADSLAAGSPVWVHAVPDNPATASDDPKVSSIRVAGDLTGDGLPDLVYAAGNYLTVALDADSQVQPGGGQAPTGPAVLWQVNTCPDNNDCGAVSGVDGLYDTGLAPAGDLDGDGTNDVVIGTGGGNDSVVAISGRTGGAIWSVGSASDPYLAPYYSVDVSGPYVATGTGSASGQSPNPVNHRRVYLLNAATGAEIWQRSTGLPNFRTRIVNGDLDGPLVVTGGGEGGTNVLAAYQILTGGTPLWSVAPSFAPFVIEPINFGLGDGLIVGGSSGLLLHVSGETGQTVWTAGGLGSSIWDVAVAPFQVQSMSTARVFVGSTRSDVAALDGVTGATVWTAETGGQVFGVDVFPDVNEDGYDEVAAVGKGGVAFLFSGADGAELWRYTFGDGSFDRSGETVTSVPDLDGNGVPEVAFGTRDGRVVLLYGGGGRPNTDTEDTPDAAAAVLDAPFPNPAVGPATLRYRLAAEGDVRLTVYDALGRAVWTYTPGRQPAGSYALDGPRGLAVGAYVVRLEAGGAAATRRLSVVR